MAIIYVGRTSNFDQRKYIHEHGFGCCKINEWERSILKDGLKPIVEILELGDCTFFEQFWIEQFTAWGFNLLNSKFLLNYCK